MFSSLRSPEVYGDARLSIQGSSSHYSSPRENDLPLDAYTTVEIAVLHDGRLVHPRSLGVNGFDEIFECGPSPVAGYVEWSDVNRLREALKARASEEADAK